jgi:hypothetical protein
MAVDNCPIDARRLTMSSLVAAGGAGGLLMLNRDRSGHDK